MKEQQQLIVPEAAPPQVIPMSESATILQVIERMAVNPAVDVEKFERLMAMHERIQARNAKAAFNAALADLQPKLPVIVENGSVLNKAGGVQSKYALWEDITQAISPLLGQHGFALSFRVGRAGDLQTVTGILSHRDGHSEETTLSLPIDMSGSKNNVQGVGSTVSYGKRYTTQSLLNLVSRGEDNDAQGNRGNDTITPDQKDVLVALMQETGSDTEKFLKYMGVRFLDDIAAANFAKAKTALETKRKKAGQEQPS